MFIKVRKNSHIYMQNNDTGKDAIVPVTSHFYLNLQQVAELSTYTLKEAKEKSALDGKTISIPKSTRVVHLKMCYNHGSNRLNNKENAPKSSQFVKAYYTLFFLPDSSEYERFRSALDKFTANAD